VRGKPTGDNTVSKYPLTMSVLSVTDSRLYHISILLLLLCGFILQNFTSLKRMVLRNVSWSQHGIQIQERIPPLQSISVVSPPLERILLKNLSWSPAWDADAGEDSSSSVYFCGVSTSREDGAKKPIMFPSWNLGKGESSSASVCFCGVLKCGEDAARKPVVVPSWDADAGEDSSSSVYFCGVSTSREDGAKKPIMFPSWNLDAGESSSASVYVCGVSKSREDCLRKSVTDPSWNPEVSKNSSASIYFCGISSGNKITPVEKDGKTDAKMGFQFGEEGQLS
jgi:hypothetical protein